MDAFPASQRVEKLHLFTAAGLFGMMSPYGSQ